MLTPHPRTFICTTQALKDVQNLVVSEVLQIFCPTFKDQVQKRTYFYRSSKLVKRGIIRVRWRPHYLSEDLADCVVTIDRRMMDWVVGLNTEINELIEGSNLYSPKVDMDHVILSEVGRACLHMPHARTYTRIDIRTCLMYLTTTPQCTRVYRTRSRAS